MQNQSDFLKPCKSRPKSFNVCLAAFERKLFSSFLLGLSQKIPLWWWKTSTCGFQAQSQLLRLQDFKSQLSYMQRFFHSYESCALALPVEPELEFIADLVNRREEMSHLPLLGHFVRLQNWIFDRLDGTLPKKFLEDGEPLLVLLRKARKRDEKMNHRSWTISGLL